jgi:hypothetical protein
MTSSAVATDPTGFSLQELQGYARKELVVGHQLDLQEIADVSQLLTAMWQLRVRYPGLTEAALVRALLKPVLDPVEQRKSECGCPSCSAKKEGGG